MKYKINGKTVTKQEWDSRPGVGLNVRAGEIPLGTVAYSETKPLVSDGLGCLKNQVPEMREEIRKRNIRGVQVLDNGQLSFTSRRARRDVCRMRGLVDGDGGYSD